MGRAAQVYIKNTFFESIDDVAPPPMSSLGRAQTDTVAQHRVSDFELGEASMDFVDRGVVKVEPVQEEEDDEGAGAVGENAAPPPLPGGLYRFTTYDEYESTNLEMDFVDRGVVKVELVQEESDEEGAGAACEAAAPPPLPGDLYRFTTYNEYESTDDFMKDPVFRNGGGGELLLPALVQEVAQEVPQKVPYQVYQMVMCPIPGCMGPQGLVSVQQLPVDVASQPGFQATGDARAALGGNLAPPPVPEASGVEAAAATAAAPPPGGLEDARLELPPPQREPVLQRAMSVNSRVYRIRWTVDARKLKGTGREAVSPSFDLSFGQQVQFKMVLRPTAISEGRGGASFKKSGGKGSVFVRCLDEVTGDMNPTVKYRISVGDITRGPVVHDFSRRAISGLDEDEAKWDFASCVNPESDTFTVSLEIMP